MGTYDPNQADPYSGGQPGGYPGQHAPGGYLPGGYPGQYASGQPGGAAPPPYGQPGYGFPSYGPVPRSTEGNWMGGWSLGLGIASFFSSFFCCPMLVVAGAAVILGIMGIVEAGKGRATNRGVAIAGLVAAICAVVLDVFVTLFFLRS